MRTTNVRMRIGRRGAGAAAVVGAALWVAMSAAPVAAQTAVTREPWHRAVAIEAVAGMETPVGTIGAYADLSVMIHPLLNLGLTLGAGSNMAGPQFALQPRLRWLLSRNVVLDGSAGISWGRREAAEHRVVAPAFEVEATGMSLYETTWANCELGIDVRTNVGLSARAFVGLAIDAYQTDDKRLFAGAAVGYAFDVGAFWRR